MTSELSPLTVALTEAEQADLPVAGDELMAALVQSPLVEAAQDPDSADLKIVAQSNAVFRFYQAGQTVAISAFRIPVKRAQALPKKLQRIVEHIAAYTNLEALRPQTDALRNAIKVEFLELLEPAKRNSTAEVARLPITDTGDTKIQGGKMLAIALTNQTQSAFNCYVTVSDPRQLSSTLVFPYQPSLPAKLRPGEAVLIGGGPQYFLEMELPEEATLSTDIFRVWVSGTTIQPGILVLPTLGQPLTVTTDPYGSGSRLDRDLRQALSGQIGTTPIPEFTLDPWWCQKQVVQIVAAS